MLTIFSFSMFFAQSCNFICSSPKVVKTIFVYIFALKKTLKDYFIDIDKAILKIIAKLYGDALVYIAVFID